MSVPQANGSRPSGAEENVLAGASVLAEHPSFDALFNQFCHAEKLKSSDIHRLTRLPLGTCEKLIPCGPGTRAVSATQARILIHGIRDPRLESYFILPDTVVGRLPSSADPGLGLTGTVVAHQIQAGRVAQIVKDAEADGRIDLDEAVNMSAAADDLARAASDIKAAAMRAIQNSGIAVGA